MEGMQVNPGCDQECPVDCIDPLAGCERSYKLPQLTILIKIYRASSFKKTINYLVSSGPSPFESEEEVKKEAAE
jgi:hypothetical protein